MIAYCLGLDIRGALVLAAAASLAFSVVVLFQFRRLFPAEPITALFLTLTLACSFIGQFGTSEAYFFDGVGYLLEAFAIYAVWPPLIALLIAAGGFADERVIAAVPLIYLVQVRPPLAKLHLRVLFKPNARQYGTIAGVLLFLWLRIMLGLHLGRQFDGAQVGFASLLYNATLLPVALVLVYKGSILMVAGGLARLVRLRAFTALLLLLIGAAPGILASLMVWDLPRSLAYTFPALLFIARILAESCRSPEVQSLALRGAILSVCFPTYYL